MLEHVWNPWTKNRPFVKQEETDIDKANARVNKEKCKIRKKIAKKQLQLEISDESWDALSEI